MAALTGTDTATHRLFNDTYSAWWIVLGWLQDLDGFEEEAGNRSDADRGDSNSYIGALHLSFFHLKSGFAAVDGARDFVSRVLPFLIYTATLSRSGKTRVKM